tara:strand:+ start:18618 stop:18899 length:282 start_codon:yes stop_codon:yes gene_type:complete
MQCLASETIQKIEIDQTKKLILKDEVVSFIQEIPEYLKEAISDFMNKYPNWDQYRLIEAAISGYLLDKGVDSREINNLYFKSMLSKKVFGENL